MSKILEYLILEDPFNTIEAIESNIENMMQEFYIAEEASGIKDDLSSLASMAKTAGDSLKKAKTPQEKAKAVSDVKNIASEIAKEDKSEVDASRKKRLKKIAIILSSSVAAAALAAGAIGIVKSSKNPKESNFSISEKLPDGSIVQKKFASKEEMDAYLRPVHLSEEEISKQTPVSRNITNPNPKGKHTTVYEIADKETGYRKKVSKSDYDDASKYGMMATVSVDKSTGKKTIKDGKVLHSEKEKVEDISMAEIMKTVNANLKKFGF